MSGTYQLKLKKKEVIKINELKFFDDEELRKSIELWFEEMLKIVKAMANETRFMILSKLLEGEKSFQILKQISSLKKTALSNHLSYLLEAHLITRSDYGVYKITNDGKCFIRGITNSFYQSDIQKKYIKQKSPESLKFSCKFLDSFFKREK